MPPATDGARIRTLVEDWARAVRAKDMDGALAHHADDIVIFDAPLPLQAQGMEEYRKSWELFFAHSPGGPGSFEVTGAADLRRRLGRLWPRDPEGPGLRGSAHHWAAQAGRRVAGRPRASLLSAPAGRPGLGRRPAERRVRPGRARGPR